MVSKSQMSLPLVSIITPSFNHGSFIEENIYSVKNQSYPNIEHIILDGGSTDNTIEVLKRHERTYRMRWLSETDRGQADAVNRGFAMAEGEIIGWLNSDDVFFDLETLAYVVAAFYKTENIQVLYGDSALIDETGRILRIECKPSFQYSRLQRGCYLIQPSVFFRKHVIEQDTLNPDLTIVMDYEYWLRIGQKYSFYHVARILSADRYHASRKIIAKRSLMKEESLRVMKDYGRVFCLSYYFQMIVDKILSGWLRLKGLRRFSQIKSKNDFAFEAKMDNFFANAYRQLLVKNRNLVRKKLKD